MILRMKAMVGLCHQGNKVPVVGSEPRFSLAFAQLRMRDGWMIGHVQ